MINNFNSIGEKFKNYEKLLKEKMFNVLYEYFCVKINISNKTLESERFL